jgi:hypothetical protein
MKLKNVEILEHREDFKTLSDSSHCYPRLQSNKRGEIVLVTLKHNTLSTGVLVGKTPDSKSKLPMGIKLTDWEVCGVLTDYNGSVRITLSNLNKNIDNASQ